MSKIGMFFGTDTGTTRKIAKMMYRELGEELAAKPLNINRVQPDDILKYEYIILGTPTLGEGLLPGLSSECQTESWEEFVPNFDDMNFEGKKVAFYGMGDQVSYPDEFVDAMGELYDYVTECGGEPVGRWPIAGYEYSSSSAEDEGEFVGLVLDNDNQSHQTEARIKTWMAQIKTEFGL